MTHLKYIDLSLSRIRYTLNKLDNFHKNIPNIIHIAGTNGKGSTLSFLKNILEHNNYTVNTFTSPHLVNYNERFYIKGHYIDDNLLLQYQQFLSNIDGFNNLSIFEATTLLGLWAFFHNPADYLILETGLGGRLDATNIIEQPLLNIITKIDFDHQNFLGNSIDKIAYEKAGIIKPNAIVISDYQDEVVQKVLRKSAKNNTFILGGSDYHVDVTNKIYNFHNDSYNLSQISLNGDHQLYNSSLALTSALMLPNIKLNHQKSLKALSSTLWLGRLQKVDCLYDIPIDNSEIYLDGAHNASGMGIVSDFIDKTEKKETQNIHIIFGMLAKKDIKQSLLKLKKHSNIIIYPISFINTSQNPHEYHSVDDIYNICNDYNLSCIKMDNIQHTLQYISETSTKRKNLIIICGSLYMIGKILSENPQHYINI